MKTRQEIFDQVAKHLLTQGKRCFISGVGCAYRGPNGTKCAAGCLIDDAFYDPAFEGGVVSAFLDYGRPVLIAKALESSGVCPDDISFVATLQIVHDKIAPEFWKQELRSVARGWDLSAAVLDQFGEKPGVEA